jgi:SsrA-binding protein
MKSSKKQAKAKKKESSSIRNRRASYDYALEDGFKFGMVLDGRQVRAIRNNHLSLTGSFVNIKDDELWLINAKLTLPKTSSDKKEVLTSVEPIKLLATKKDLKEISSAKKSGRTVVPTEVLNRTRYIKLRASIGKGKREYDKRETKKKRQFEIQSKRDFKDL